MLLYPVIQISRSEEKFSFFHSLCVLTSPNPPNVMWRGHVAAATPYQAPGVAGTLCTSCPSLKDLISSNGAQATSIFDCDLDPVASVACSFCKEQVEEMLFHAFLDCLRLKPLFAAFSDLFGALDLDLSEPVYILSIPHQVAWPAWPISCWAKARCQP